MYNDVGTAASEERIVLQAQKLKGAREAVTEKVSCETLNARSCRGNLQLCMAAPLRTRP